MDANTKENILARLKVLNRKAHDIQQESAELIALLGSAEETETAPGEAAAYQVNVAPLVGPDGVIAKYLHEDIFPCGQGELRQRSGVLEQHEEDILHIPSQMLRSWPSGFYRNRTTMYVQLLVVTDHFVVCLDISPEELWQPQVCLIDGPRISDKRFVHTLSIENHAVLLAEVEAALQKLTGLYKFY